MAKEIKCERNSKTVKRLQNKIKVEHQKTFVIKQLITTMNIKLVEPLLRFK